MYSRFRKNKDVGTSRDEIPFLYNEVLLKREISCNVIIVNIHVPDWDYSYLIEETLVSVDNIGVLLEQETESSVQDKIYRSNHVEIIKNVDNGKILYTYVNFVFVCHITPFYCSVYVLLRKLGEKKDFLLLIL